MVVRRGDIRLHVQVSDPDAEGGDGNGLAQAHAVRTTSWTAVLCHRLICSLLTNTLGGEGYLSMSSPVSQQQS